MRKLIEVTLVALATLIAIVPVVTPQVHVNASVSVGSTCDVQANPATISFDSLVPGGIKDGTGQDINVSQVLGNNLAKVTVSGNNWDTLSGFLVGQTHWGVGVSNTTYSGEVPLTQSTVVVDPALAGTGFDIVHFGLMVPAHQTATSYTQTITFTVSCDTSGE